MSTPILSLIEDAVSVGIQIIVTLWKDILDWLGKLVVSIKNLFTNVLKGVNHAAGVFLQENDENTVSVTHKLYYQNENGQYMEKTSEKIIDKSEVPDWAMAKMNKNNAVDMTRDFEAELQMKI